MARKITQNAVNAFFQRQYFKQGNTEVLHLAEVDGKFPKGDHYIVMELHGNKIARMDVQTGILEINNCGWLSNVTRERLWGLGADFYTEDGEWYMSYNHEKMPINKWIKAKE